MWPTEIQTKNISMIFSKEFAQRFKIKMIGLENLWKIGVVPWKSKIDGLEVYKRSKSASRKN